MIFARIDARRFGMAPGLVTESQLDARRSWYLALLDLDDAFDRRGQEVVLLQIEQVGMSDLIERNEQVARPAAIGPDCERAKARGTDLEFVR